MGIFLVCSDNDNIEHDTESTFMPQRGTSSILLVQYVSGRVFGLAGLVSVVSYWGAGWRWECEIDEQASLEALADHFTDQQDGLFIMEGRWVGSGEDCEFEISSLRELNNDERDSIIEERCLEGIVCFWASQNPELLCDCGYAAKSHEGYLMKCPKKLDDCEST